MYMKTALAALLLCAQAARADVPLFVAQHGRLRDAQDEPVNAVVNLKVRFHKKGVDAPTGQGGFEDNLVAEYTFASVQVTGGAYTVLVGPLDPAKWDGAEDRWMAVQIGDDVEMSPRLQVSAVPWALKARDADLFGNEPPSHYASDADLDALSAAVSADYFKKTGGTVTGALTLSGSSSDLSVGGAGSVAGALTVTGTAALNGGTTTTTLTATDVDAATLDVTGAASLSSLAVNGAATVGGALNVSNSATVGSLISEGSGTFDGNVQAAGNVKAAALRVRDATTGTTELIEYGGVTRIHHDQVTGSGQLFSVAGNRSNPLASFRNNGGPALAVEAGNVGIGTSAPTARLHITGGGEPYIRLGGTGRPSIQFERAGALDWDIGTDDCSGASCFWFGDFSSYRMVIHKGTGNVGIGTSTPTQKLEVAGTIKATDSVGLNTFHFIATPQNLRLTCNANAQTVNDNVPPQVPTNATAVLATITTYNDQNNDHVVHSFGRKADHYAAPWSNEVHNQNAYLNDVLITHEGDTPANTYYYGHSHGTNIIPLKSNGKFDARLCMGHSRGTHYITIQVYGYIL